MVELVEKGETRFETEIRLEVVGVEEMVRIWLEVGRGVQLHRDPLYRGRNQRLINEGRNLDQNDDDPDEWGREGSERG